MRFIFVASVAFAFPAFGAAAMECPDFTLPATSELSYSEDDLWSERTHGVAAGGALDLWNCSLFDGAGHVSLRPDFNVQLTRNIKDRMIRFMITGDDDCDTVLLINTPDGSWLFNDDYDGVDPAVHVHSAPPGRYDVWAGTFGPDLCIGTLHIEAFP
ncbi:hypothetical protein [Roseinatronobacter alkalisoli]|uniref:Peptidase S1 n=1 Tax=Roseinatronobacter alkalisoli TaxID=3028235 RepID=A0ABT5T4M2_9RHOB|nr:hypothetical protein [Roseinatronobacter sp. HJB301]MDD7970065.1 hypothetical protein [Roseinatronobacter sp. HJB301]